MADFQIQSYKHYQKITFAAMASDCEILLSSKNVKLAQRVAQIGVSETRRFEKKFSRYLIGNLCWRMNQSQGNSVVIDKECFNLLEYANQLYQLSDGLFDITSGVLRKIWTFKPAAKPPADRQIRQLLAQIGFDQIKYNQNSFVAPAGVEIDFGGIGKEYCVDRVANLVAPICRDKKVNFLVNFGGDLSAVSFSDKHPGWCVGLENVEPNTNQQSAESPAIIQIEHGAVATSGSSKRFIEFEGKRYSHILNPITGYPINHAPRSVSVFAKTCSLAGGMSTLAQLQGDRAKDFLNKNKVKYICCE